MKNYWTEEEIKLLEDCYSKYISMSEMLKIFKNRTKSSITNKANSLGLPSKYVKPYNSKFKAIYQDYDWCYQHYIIEGMSYQEMADLCGATKRVIEKWCSERHRLNRFSKARLKTLTDEQRQIIIMGTLGDGHIDKRPTQHMYIECHSIAEKDYLFWKYNKLKNLCNREPVYKKETVRNFKGKDYQCKPQYRMETHILHCLTEIFEMTTIQKLSEMTILGLCLYLLDDGNRNSSNWNLCVAMLSEEDKKFFIEKCKELGFNCWVIKDTRYIIFDSNSSRKLDKEIISIFGEIDIVHKKILDKYITKGAKDE